MGLSVNGCSPQKAEQVKTVQIADGTIDPAEWGKAYPVEYEMWKKTAEPPDVPGLSKYKKGNDDPKSMVDKLSEYPYLALLFNGWGFGIGYNEPRGHSHMVQDQLDIDASRVKAGGVCLTCKTPYVNHLVKTMGADYYKTPYKEVLAKIPDQKNATLSVSCSDCHDNKDMSLALSRDFTLGAALRGIGVDTAKLDHQTKRTLVCAQCHVTYVVTKDKEMHSTGVFFPWEGSKLGNITIENIIKKIRATLPTASGNRPLPDSSWLLSVTPSTNSSPTTVFTGRQAHPVPIVICRTPRSASTKHPTIASRAR